ncbi:MAG: hypothetical protein ACO21G_06245, partial [Algoriphagus sp.]
QPPQFVLGVAAEARAAKLEALEKEFMAARDNFIRHHEEQNPPLAQKWFEETMRLHEQNFWEIGKFLPKDNFWVQVVN